MYHRPPNLIFVIFFLLSACSKENECSFFPADYNQEIKQVKIDQTTYYLYRYVSGFHDKVFFFHLYDKKPVFDSCGRADQKLVAGSLIEASGDPVRIIVVNSPLGGLEIEYKETDEKRLPEDVEIVMEPAKNKKLKQVIIGQKTYYLYLQTTGVHEREDFFVLYDSDPSFDSYGRPSITPIGYAVILPDTGVPVRITFTGESKMDVQYDQNASANIPLEDVGKVIDIDIKQEPR